MAQRPQAPQREAVNGRQLGVRHRLLLRVEVMQVAQQVAQRAPQLAVRLRHLLHDAGANEHIGCVVHAGHPQPQGVRPIRRLLLLVGAALNQAPGVNHVANGLAHLLPLLVQHKAVGQHTLVRRLARGRHAGEQAALEPAPVLV